MLDDDEGAMPNLRKRLDRKRAEDVRDMARVAAAFLLLLLLLVLLVVLRTLLLLARGTAMMTLCAANGGHRRQGAIVAQSISNRLFVIPIRCTVC